MGNSVEERALVARAKAGDSAAFGLLVSRYLEPVYRVAYRVVRNHEDAADIAQETMVRAFRGLDRFKEERPLFPWLYQIARNLGINRLQRVRNREVSLPEFDSLQSRFADPEAELLAETQRERVRRAVASLPERHREIIELSHFDGYSYQEMAEILGIPVGTVMSRLYHARKRLQKVLETEELPHAR